MSIENLLSDVRAAVDKHRVTIHRSSGILLKDVFQRVSTLRQAKRRFADELAPDFHFFDYLRSDELGLSRCLADLLDPTLGDGHGKHGQAGLFLDTLIKHLTRSENTKSISQWASSKKCESVSLEQPTDHGRRIDVVIRFRDGGLLGIENKPWAVDQINQLTDYADYLATKSTNNQWLLVYLSNRAPDRGSIDEDTREKIEESGNFSCFSFKDAEAWLQEATEKTRAIKVRLFVQDLVNFIHTKVIGEIEMSEGLEIQESVLSSGENLEAAFLIANQFKSIQLALTNKLIDNLEVCILNRPYRLEKNKHFVFGIRWEELGVIFYSTQNQARLVFGFDSNGYRDFYVGIATYDKDSVSERTLIDIRKVMTDLFCESEPHDATYPWYIYFDNPCLKSDGFRNWQDSAKPWVAINEGTMASQMIEISNRVYEAFEGKRSLLSG